MLNDIENNINSLPYKEVINNKESYIELLSKKLTESNEKYNEFNKINKISIHDNLYIREREIIFVNDELKKETLKIPLFTNNGGIKLKI